MNTQNSNRYHTPTLAGDAILLRAYQAKPFLFKKVSLTNRLRWRWNRTLRLLAN